MEQSVAYYHSQCKVLLTVAAFSKWAHLAMQLVVQTVSLEQQGRVAAYTLGQELSAGPSWLAC